MELFKRNIIAITVACTIFSCSPSNEGKNEPPNDPEPSVQLPISRATTNLLETKLQQAGLVSIQSLDSLCLVDLKYSTTDNFVGVDVYGSLDKCYLQSEVAGMLATAQQDLNLRQPGYRLLIFDCARPLSVQKILWDTLQKPEDLKHLYVADPKEGSIHNYGSAVDLSIVDETGVPLDMGTEYDHFGELAYPSKEEELVNSGVLTQHQVENRLLLREVMAGAGFTPINTEWWHFNAYSRQRAAELFEMIE